MKPATSRVLHLLREAGSDGLTTSELVQAGAGNRFGARIRELREEGHRISTRRISPSKHRYTLTKLGAVSPEGRTPNRPIPDDPAPEGVVDRRLPALRGGRLYRDQPGFRWDQPPIALPNPALHFDLRPGHRATYWGSLDESRQTELAA